MKILLITGNNEIEYGIMKKVENRFKKFSDVNIDKISLKNYIIKNCEGCQLCINKEKKLCFLPDDFNHLKNKIDISDGIVILLMNNSKEIYNTLNNFIKRFSYINPKISYADKKIMIISNYSSKIKKIFKPIRNPFRLGPHIVTELNKEFSSHFVSENIYIENDILLNRECKKFYKVIKNNINPKPSIQDFIEYRINKEIYSYKLFEDENYYNNIKEYYENRINPIKKIIGNIIYWFMFRAKKKVKKDNKSKYYNSWK